MKSYRRTPSYGAEGVFIFRLVLLSLLMAAGMLLGYGAYNAVANHADQELDSYILHYAQLLAETGGEGASPLAVALVYFRYPVLLLLCGFTALGTMLVAALCAVQGFFLAFSVSCFVKQLGQTGAWLAACAFGQRCLFVLPCSLVIGVWAITVAKERKERGGKQPEHRGNDRTLYHHSGVSPLLSCLLVLVIGVVLELLLVPRWFSLVLANILSQ